MASMMRLSFSEPSLLSFTNPVPSSDLMGNEPKYFHRVVSLQPSGSLASLISSRLSSFMQLVPLQVGFNNWGGELAGVEV